MAKLLGEGGFLVFLNLRAFKTLDTGPEGVMLSRPPIGFENLVFVGSFRVSAVVDEMSSINFRKGGSEGGWSQSPNIVFLFSFFCPDFDHS